jgi:hypothetical protein
MQKYLRKIRVGKIISLKKGQIIQWHHIKDLLRENLDGEGVWWEICSNEDDFNDLIRITKDIEVKTKLLLPNYKHV